jgi:hypothetical protein
LKAGEYLKQKDAVVGAEAINAHNKKQIEFNDAKIKALQSTLFETDAQIVQLTAEISDYFSNLKGVIKSEFKGSIELDVELQSFVMSRGEYDDCFKITADGKVFPYECNGALQNNVKLQILNGFQKLVNYKGITILDNCEANTTQPINILDTKCVLAFATNDNELIIK